MNLYGLYILSAAQNLSLFFAVLNFAFSFMGGVNTANIFYLWLVLLTAAIKFTRTKYPRLLFLPVAILALPFIWVRNLNDMVLLFLASLYSLYFVFRDLDKKNYGLSVDFFKKGVWLAGVIFVLSLLAHGINGMGNFFILFLIIFLATSILVLRTLRHLEYNRATGEMDKINIRYTVAVLLLSFVLSLQYVRDLMLHLIIAGYLAIVDLIMYLFSWVLYYIGNVVTYVVLLLRKLHKKSIVHESTPAHYTSKLKFPSRNDLFFLLKANHFINTSFKVLCILVAVYILVKLFQRNAKGLVKGEDYEENRETIVSELKKNSLAQRLSSLFRPRDYSAYIRYYYAGYLKLCRERNIEIEKSDTSLEVNKKAGEQFDRDIIGAMRDIYIKIRYGGIDGDRNTAGEFYKYYKKLKESSKHHAPE